LSHSTSPLAFFFNVYIVICIQIRLPCVSLMQIYYYTHILSLSLSFLLAVLGIELRALQILALPV
jgi:hypothetical protein